MEETKSGPNASDSAPNIEGTKTFGYDVSAQARKKAKESRNENNPNSPLAAG